MILSIPTEIVSALPADVDPRDALRQIISAALSTPWPSAGRKSSHGLTAAQVTHLGRLLASDPDLDPRVALERAKAFTPRARKPKGDDASAPETKPETKPRKRAR
jgi:hypothetical protein